MNPLEPKNLIQFTGISQTMDCVSLIGMIESKFGKTIKPFGREENLSETERHKYLEVVSDFLKWMEDTILRTPVEVGEETISAKQCILNSMNDDADESKYPDLWNSLALFSDLRLKQIFGVAIFSDDTT